MFCGKILASRISCARLCFDLCCEKFHFLGKVLLSLKIMTFMLSSCISEHPLDGDLGDI